MTDSPPSRPPETGSWQEVFSAFFRLGLTSFGGPVAHLGFFRSDIVEKRKWLSEAAYAELVALCQFLPGPASSQVGMGLGFVRAGYAGAAAAFFAFTLPSFLIMALLGMGVAVLPDGVLLKGALAGLKTAVVAVVAQAVWGMAQTLTPDKPRIGLAVICAALVLLWTGAPGQVAAIVLGGLTGLAFCKNLPVPDTGGLSVPVSRRAGSVFLSLFFVLLIGLPVLAGMSDSHVIDIIDRFYRAGSLVFGGGHVVLPLLQSSMIDPGWMSEPVFLAGYGAAQAVPGPLFTVAAYLGAAATPEPDGMAGATIATCAIFLPAFLLVGGCLPFWQHLTHYKALRSALAGVNAAVVGLLLAALYDPVWTGGIVNNRDFLLAVACFAALQIWKLPAWAVVSGAALIGGFIAVLV